MKDAIRYKERVPYPICLLGHNGRQVDRHIQP
jgi:hypothetical protein